MILEKKKAEEAARAAEDKKKKEKLLLLRSQNSKNNKKAKIMASRTKDNDFSRIKLSEDELASKQKIEQEIQRKHLNDKVERMKCRIELEEKEKALPKKRKRKSKTGEIVLEPYVEEKIEEKFKDSKNNFKSKSSEHKSQRPPPPPMSFHELLKVAEKKQHEPIHIPVKAKTEERLFTKRERKIFEEEQERARRIQERAKLDELPKNSKSLKPSKHSSNNEKSLTVEKSTTKKPHIIHVEKGSKDESQKFKIPKSSASVGKSGIIPKIEKRENIPKVEKSAIPKTEKNKVTKPSSSNHKSLTLQTEARHSQHTPSVKSQTEKHLKSDREKLSKSSKSGEKLHTSKQLTNHEQEKSSQKTIPMTQKHPVKQNVKTVVKPVFKKPLPKKNGIKIAPVTATPPTQELSLSSDTLAKLEQCLRERLEKEIAEKMAAELASIKSAISVPPPALKPTINKVPEKTKHVNGTHSTMNGRTVNKVPSHQAVRNLPKKNGERTLVHPRPSERRPGPSKPPPPKPFHPNPYLDPPRRRLEPQLPVKKKRRIEDEDDDDEDDDDMSDFIDDRPSQNDEDYSKYIKEIFNYDRNKYVDIDDDDIVESSYVEQMKEETRSTKLGYLEDLEEERKLREMEKKRKMKKMRK
ncbi:protein SPT2 homolog [Caerostris extrusa]|uniref:Protein SPT2 homolog n=1 Tax=Caerostris extrusa TaxID=172846 RepID=A0AAV4QY39_CAEEX|nr:protein SPT2 homolog [Caerostris extrusa]